MICYIPFVFCHKNKIVFISTLFVLVFVYVNLGLPYRVKHREERYTYTYWFI